MSGCGTCRNDGTQTASLWQIPFVDLSCKDGSLLHGLDDFVNRPDRIMPGGISNPYFYDLGVRGWTVGWRLKDVVDSITIHGSNLLHFTE